MSVRSPANISGMPLWLLRVTTVIVLLVAVYLAFEFGRIQAGYNLADAVTERQQTSQRIAGLERQIASLKEEIAMLETHREIDRQAYRDVEGNLVELQRKIQEQRDAIGFYRGIVSPDDGGRGLRVQDFRLTPGGDAREYNLRLVLVQAIQNDRTVQGDVGMTFEGEEAGEAVSYSYEELAPADEDSSWPFRFRYFQDFTRQVVLPEGFRPAKVNIEVRSRTKSVASVEQSFLWPTGQS